MSNKPKRNYIDADFENRSARKKGKTGHMKVTWDDTNIKTVETLSGIGLNESQIASHFGVSQNSFTKYKKEVPGIVEAIAKGKAKAIANVAKTAYEMAMSKEHPTMTQFWLKNRAKEEWSDKQTIEHQGKIEGSSERVAEVLTQVLDFARDVKPVEPIILESKKDEPSST